MDLFAQIIHVDFIALLTLLYLGIFMKFNDAYDRNVNRIILPTLILATLLVASDNMDYYYSRLSTPHALHQVFIMAGYILRTFLIVCAVLVLKRGRVTKREKILLFLPATVNFCVIMTAPFHDKVFWIDEHNVLHRELLSFTPHFICIVYFIVALAIAIKRHLQGYRDEALLLYVALASIPVGVVAEIVLKTRGVLVSAILMMLTFYYLYLHMEHFKRDHLTGAFNRMSFFADLEKLRPEQITAFCEIDMNGLKQINDEQGHAEGDKAIITVSSVILRCLSRHSHLYRLGGDEFAILFCEIPFSAVEQAALRIREEMEKTPYSCAIGTAQWDPARSFEEIYNLADERMYADKRSMKAKMKG